MMFLEPIALQKLPIFMTDQEFATDMATKRSGDSFEVQLGFQWWRWLGQYLTVVLIWDNDGTRSIKTNSQYFLGCKNRK
jgi:hypothetical protein